MSLELFVDKNYPFSAPRVRFMNNCHNFQLDDYLNYPSQLFLWPRLASSYSAARRRVAHPNRMSWSITPYLLICCD